LGDDTSLEVSSGGPSHSRKDRSIDVVCGMIAIEKELDNRWRARAKRITWGRQGMKGCITTPQEVLTGMYSPFS
jgi:hypothetical protein